MPVAARDPAQLLFYRLSEIDPAALAHRQQGQWTPMHYNCSSQVLKQPKLRVKRKRWAISITAQEKDSLTDFNTKRTLLSLYEIFTLQCFSASLNSLFFMASLALFSSDFTSLLDIWSKPWDTENKFCFYYCQNPQKKYKCEYTHNASVWKE